MNIAGWQAFMTLPTGAIRAPQSRLFQSWSEKTGAISQERLISLFLLSSQILFTREINFLLGLRESDRNVED